MNNLKPAPGSTRKRKRIGRGQGSGYGGTSTRGHKGAQSRSGYSRKAGFEGGQMPIQRRLPKGGFKNPNRTEYYIINLDKLQELADTYKLKKIDPVSLHESKIIKKTDKVKVLARGEVKGKLDVTVHAISKKAQEAIESAGGTVNLIS